MENIVYIGQFNDACGYANASRMLLRTFYNNGFTNENLKICSLNFEKENFASQEDNKLINYFHIKEQDEFLKKPYKVIYHLCPHLINSLPYKDILEKSKENINFVYWECDSIPYIWKQQYDSGIFKKILTACDWNKDVFSKETNIPTYVYRQPLQIKKLNKLEDNIFRIFSMSQWTYRKGFDILLKAYCQEFFDNTDTELFIKTYRYETLKGADINSEKNAILEEAKRYKNSVMHYSNHASSKILIKTGFVSEEEISSYYAKSNVFCLPTRGEGFGLTIAQAALNGVPCIVPNIGGHVDLFDKSDNNLVNSKYEFVTNLNGIYSKDMRFIETDIQDLRKKLRYFYELWKNNKQKLEEIGTKTREYAEKVLDEKQNFSSLLDVINK